MNVEDLLLYFFAGSALFGAALMLVAQHPMRVALALITTMLSLAGVYALLGVHVVAVFQVLIYVGAVMVFMVYVIMLLDVRDPSFIRRYGSGLVPGVVLGVMLSALLAAGRVWFGQTRWLAPMRRLPLRTWSSPSRSSSCRTTGCISS